MRATLSPMIRSLSGASATDQITARVCIIGAGAAGITLACELDGAGFAVLLMESGGFRAIGAGKRDAYHGSTTAPHPEPVEYRRVGFGGTTSLWGGRCVPFDPIDFEQREYVSDSGWPITYDEVAQFYPRALYYCDAGEFDFSLGALRQLGAATCGVDGASDTLFECIERYSLPTHFGKARRRQIERSTNVTALLDARCLRLVQRPGETQVTSAEFSARDGSRYHVHADLFVLATGGLETPRILFVSDRQGVGIGNQNDLLGRFYACHFANVLATLKPGNKKPVPFQFEKTTDGVYARRKIQFSPEAQRKNRLLNSTFRLHFSDYGDARHGSAAMSTIFLAKSLLVAEYQKILRHAGHSGSTSSRKAHLKNVVRGIPELAAFGSTWLSKRVLARRKLPYTLIANADGSFPLEFNSEQIPLQSNRVSLQQESDRDGLPRIHVHWRISEEDVTAAFRAFVLLKETIDSAGACTLHFDERELASRLRLSPPVGGHHLGTTRMGVTEKSGVVDKNCKVFGTPNVYVASASVFATSSHANPTLTIVAIAIRLAAHLKRELAR